MRLIHLSKLICLLVLMAAVVVPVYGAGHYALAYWREVGYNENSNNHSMYVHVFDENGNPRSGVELRTTWNVLLGTTDANGYCEVVMSVQNSYDMVCVDSSGSTSDVAYTMTSRRWPNWGHYSYNLAFMYKSNRTSPGTFDTTLLGTLNLADSGETDAPCTKSLTYYNLNPLDWYSDPLKLGTSSSYFGQTFVANANRIVACKVQATTGFGNHMRWSARILQGGPDGTPIGPVKTTREMVSDEYHPILVTWGINDVPVTPGNTYFLKIWNADGGQMSTYYCQSNNYASGSYYENSSPISNFDIKGLVVAASAGPPPTGLQNPGFEAGFSSEGVAANWTSWVTTGTPQFLDEPSFTHSGAHAQKWWSSWTLHDAGIYQQLSATPGASYTFSAWTWRYDPWNNGGNNVTDWVGIDPRGGIDPTSSNIIWDAGAYSWGIWTKQQVTAAAQTDVVTVFVRGKAKASGSAMVTEVDDAEFGVTPTTGTISGSVKDTNNNPISGATVSTTTGGYSTTTSANGSYTLDNIAPGTYSVVASRTIFGSQTQAGKTVSTGQTTTCNFTLSAPQVISTIGELKKMIDGLAVSLLNKVVSRKGTSAFWVQEEDRSSGIKVIGATTASEGSRINVAGLLSTQNGERTLESPEIGSTASGTAPAPLGMANTALGTNNISLLVTCWGRVTCVTSDSFYMDDGSVANTGQSCRGIKVSTGALVEPLAGKFVRVTGISGLEADSESCVPVLRVLKQGDILSIRESDLPLGVVSGRVTSGTSPLAGATVQTTTGAYSTTTNSNGYYTLEDIESGVYDVSASKNGYMTQTISGKTVTDGETLTVDFNLALLPGSISGQVTDTSDAPLSGATVSTNIGGYSTTTNASGNYTLAGVSPGTYNVTASKPGYITQNSNGIVVSTNQTTNCSLKLQTQPPFSGITNGNMEGGFRNDPDVDHQTANSWSRYILSGAPKNAGDYGQYHSSHWSQSIYESNWTEAIYQRATNAVIGQNYTASAWVKGSSSDVKFWIGIDPAGGANPGAASVLWSAQMIPGGTWTQITKTAAATGSSITIFIKAQNPAVVNNYAWIDDALLTGQ